MITSLNHTSYSSFPGAIGAASVVEQLIGENVFNAEICFGALLVDQTLNLIYPTLPTLVWVEWCRVEVEVVGCDPKRMRCGGIVLCLRRDLGQFSINPWTKLVLYLWVTETEGYLGDSRWRRSNLKYRGKLIADSWVCLWVVLGWTTSNLQVVFFHHFWTDNRWYIFFVADVLELKNLYQILQEWEYCPVSLSVSFLIVRSQRLSLIQVHRIVISALCGYP